MPDARDIDDDAGRIEAGRLLFARPWHFLRGAGSVGGLPPAEGIEVAFAGRSNVGKSSLINALVGQKALARTSNTPGRTRELNLFGADAGITIVDMPGYGYARAPKTEVAAWTRAVFDYLRGRANLRRVYLLVDARHGLKANDEEALAIARQGGGLLSGRADQGRQGEAGGAARPWSPTPASASPSGRRRIRRFSRPRPRPAPASTAAGRRSRRWRQLAPAFVRLSQTRYRPALASPEDVPP